MLKESSKNLSEIDHRNPDFFLSLDLELHEHNIVIGNGIGVIS